jgi:hypothetical protein
MAFLITETVQDIKVIKEAREDGKKNLYLEGIFMMANEPNRNGRIYEQKVLAPAVEKYTEQYIKNNRAYGELGHPIDPVIHLERVCVKHESLTWDGNYVIGRCKVTSTPMGEIVRGLIEDGFQLGMSSRGMGSVSKNSEGIMMVGSDFTLATAADVVADPSAPTAFVKGIMENVQWVYDSASGNWRAQEFLESAKQQLKKSSLTSINENSISYFRKFLNELSKK